jgi:hypothetical protein
MSTIRRMASWLLSAIVQHSSAESRSWGNAMLREMDFAESDWTALLWAVGSTTALCGHSVTRQVRMWFDRSRHEALSLKGIAKRTPAMVSGIAVAGAVLITCILALSHLIHASWFEPTQGKLAERLLVVVVPEAVYMVSAVALWRQRKSVALGILAAAMALITHAIVHFATHG